jgi:hypothetical protein
MVAAQTVTEAHPRSLALPPVTHTSQGAWRRVGVEVEFTGIPLELIANVVADACGGRVVALSRYEYAVTGDARGDWRCELDFRYLKEQGREVRDPEALLSDLQNFAERLLFIGANQVVPLEVVSPPLALNELADVERVIEALRAAGARGTSDNLLYAFGLHLNPELPTVDADTITRYLRAFLCLYEWLKRRAHVDIARRVTAYIDPFPAAYVRQVVATGYRPMLGHLIDDYLTHNATRNRALDMLPVFAHIDEDRVRRRVDDPRIKPRPALHYRLPNCEIDRPGWGIEPAWTDWLAVERLAADEPALNELCVRYSAFLDRPIGRYLEHWLQHLEPWIANRHH